MIQPLWKTVWLLFTKIKLNILLPYNPQIMYLVIYLNNLKTYVHTKAQTTTFTAVLFRIVKTWKQTRCSSKSNWIALASVAQSVGASSHTKGFPSSIPGQTT